MITDKNSYRRIIKSTANFGGIQVFQILIGLIRTKVVAVFLGPTGMGIVGLFQASIQLVLGLTNFGLSTSAINNISKQDGDDMIIESFKSISVLRYLIWFSALTGALLTIVFSNFLSQITFGNDNYAWAFSFLSLAVFFNHISTGKIILLRALRHTKIIMRTLIFGNVFGLVLTVPLYTFYGHKGIVPSLIIIEVSSLFFAFMFSLKLAIPKIGINFNDFTKISRKMLSLGLIVSFSGIITLVFNYVLRIFIGDVGSVSDVGLYNAGFAVINTYVGMIFSAMATDYYPELVAISGNVEKERDLINQQAIIAILIISPIIIPFILFIKWFIYIFYSEQFLPINNMILFAAAGMIFKSLGWAFAFLFLARSSRKLYFWNEFIFNIYMLVFNLIGYYYFGLTGLGISFILAYFLYAVQVYFISKTRFNFEISTRLSYLFIVNLFFVFLAIVLAFIMADSRHFYHLAFTLLSFVISYNLFWLDKLLGLREKFFAK